MAVKWEEKRKGTQGRGRGVDRGVEGALPSSCQGCGCAGHGSPCPEPGSPTQAQGLSSRELNAQAGSRVGVVGMFSYVAPGTPVALSGQAG